MVAVTDAVWYTQRRGTVAVSAEGAATGIKDKFAVAVVEAQAVSHTFRNQKEDC
jgi:hypothetical protein